MSRLVWVFCSARLRGCFGGSVVGYKVENFMLYLKKLYGLILKYGIFDKCVIFMGK